MRIAIDHLHTVTKAVFSGSPECGVDMGVYGAHRLFRLPFTSKGIEDRPFYPLGDEAFKYVTKDLPFIPITDKQFMDKVITISTGGHNAVRFARSHNISLGPMQTQALETKLYRLLSANFAWVPEIFPNGLEIQRFGTLYDRSCVFIQIPTAFCVHVQRCHRTAKTQLIVTDDSLYFRCWASGCFAVSPSASLTYTPECPFFIVMLV